jgi:hypothetical protein
MDEFKEHMSRLGLPQSATPKFESFFKSSSLTILQKVLVQIATHVTQRMEKKFMSIFSHDEDGLPRRWNKHDDLKSIFRTATMSAEILLDELSLIRMSDNTDDGNHVHLSWFAWQNNGLVPTQDESEAERVPAKLIVIRRENAHQALENFKSWSHGMYLQATIAQESSASSQGLVFINQRVVTCHVVLFLIIGRHDLLFLLTQPILLIIMFIVAMTVFVLYRLGLFPLIAAMTSRR